MVLRQHDGLRVTVANGDRILSLGLARGVDLVINEETFAINFYGLPLDSFDVIIGIQWLRTLGSIIWDFSTLKMSFWHVTSMVSWSSVASPRSPHVNSYDGHDLLSTVLVEYTNLFPEPRGLPPTGTYDNRIHLLPGTDAVVVRPYRYPYSSKRGVGTSMLCHEGARHYPQESISVFLSCSPCQETRRVVAFLCGLPSTQ